MTDKYEMSLDLNVLNHLGINLYSNVPSVLAEAVANAWDADAKNVKIDINTENSTITIEDDGHGMGLEDINDKYLTVGYERRKQGEELSKELKRKVMGRKGIGKLSLFSVADEIRIETCIKGKSPEGFTMSLPDIRDAIKNKEGSYNPAEIPHEKISDIKIGTRIIITKIRKNLTKQTESGLRKRLARRFSIIGEEHNFSLSIDNKPITIEDRDYTHKIQYLWTFGPDDKKFKNLAKNAEKTEHKISEIFTGWIGTVKEVGQLKDDDSESLNKIVVMMRGKLAHEDILESFGEGGIYANYIIGEVHADFLDEDNEEDVATTSRQSINESSERFTSLKNAIQEELKNIQSKWTNYRTEGGTKSALKDPVISTWFEKLGPDDQKSAKKLFGRINQVSSQDLAQRKELFKYGILAFESMRVRKNLALLDGIDIENLVEFGKIFRQTDDLEATMYYQIVQSRVNVVKKLVDHVEEDVLEKVLQELIFDHLWLLNASWDRATNGTEYMEKQVTSEFEQVTAKLSDTEKSGRIDIKYRTSAGKHIIIELKRASVKTDTATLFQQVQKYRNALKKVLVSQNREHEAIEEVCIVGKELIDYANPNGKEESEKVLNAINARVITYQQLIESTHEEYSDYLNKSKEAGELNKLLSQISIDIEN